MFRGRSKHTLDEKGRLAIPARFKQILKQKEESCLVVTNHLNCLWAFAKDDWRIIEEKAANLSLMDSHLFSSGSVEQTYFNTGISYGF